MTTLKQKSCTTCKPNSPKVTSTQMATFMKELDTDWNIVENTYIERQYRVANFSEAMELANYISEIAEDENHHPDLHIGWGKLKVTITTHACDGLTENDFILAAKIDNLQ